MSKSLIVKNSVTIKAKPAKVWQVLTDPAFTAKYMYGCAVVSEWNVGSPVIWRGADGTIYVQGKVVAIKPGKSVQFTCFDPNGGYKDMPANYTTVSYDLSAKGSETVLDMEQGDFAKGEDGEKRYNDTVGSWEGVLAKIKEIAES